MTESARMRLDFLVRVVRKEIELVMFAQRSVFLPYFTLENARALNQDPEFAMKVEAFASRFARLQDTVGDKLLPAWLEILSERIGPAIDNLNKAEKLGVLNSVDDWLVVRGLRNQMVHEYIESLEVLTDALNQANKHVELIVSCANAIIRDCQQRGLIAGD
ncbi:MAG: hypothetical protein M1572_02920 [Gammaproteobacteria bacterium]|nr:hypothetical protein [Gammaproteobacteria bacterium]